MLHTTPPEVPNWHVTPAGQQDPGKLGQQRYPAGQVAELQACLTNNCAGFNGFLIARKCRSTGSALTAVTTSTIAIKIVSILAQNQDDSRKFRGGEWSDERQSRLGGAYMCIYIYRYPLYGLLLGLLRSGRHAVQNSAVPILELHFKFNFLDDDSLKEMRAGCKYLFSLSFQVWWRSFCADKWGVSLIRPSPSPEALWKVLEFCFLGSRDEIKTLL